MYYSEELVEEVRSRNDIVDVIGSYIGLKHQGASYTACCPFHQEKTPSFHVSRSKQIYKCFGCGEGGNVISFVMKYENQTFQEALQTLADRSGIVLPKRELSPEERKAADYKSLMLEINKEAAKYFHYLLHQKQGAPGLQYLKNRGITEETIQKFALGFADITRDDLYQYLRHKGYADEMIRDSQLADLDEKRGAHDKFWNRVMYPILDANNHVIGFGGRIMGTGDRKYLNSNDSQVFKKRNHLYGLYLAKKHSQKKGIILCEGYMDVISMHQAGFDTAVASLGTAFTPEQAQLLKRYTDKVYLAYDSDGAGVKATCKAIAILRRYGYQAKVISLAPYKDPDELIQKEGAQTFETRIQEAVDGVAFLLAQAASGYRLDDPGEKTRFVQEMIQILVTIADPLERDNYLSHAAKVYQVDYTHLRNRVNEIGYRENTEEATVQSPVARRQQEEAGRQEAKQQSQKLLLTYLVNQPELIGSLQDIIGAEDFYEPVFHEVATAIYQQYAKTGTVMPASILNQFPDVEVQSQAANIFQTDLPYALDAAEERKALTELVKNVKNDSIAHALQETSDLERWQALSKEKNKIMLWQMP